MKSVNIAALKARLSAYLDDVRRGEEIIVRDRKKAIARIIPLSTDTLDEEEDLLAAEGLLRPPRARFDRAFWNLSAPRLKGATAARAVTRDRDER